MVDSKFVTCVLCACLVGVLAVIFILIETKHEARCSRDAAIQSEKQMMEMIRDVKLAPAISPMRRGSSWRTEDGEIQTVEMSCGVGEDVDQFLIRFRARVMSEKEEYPPSKDR